MRGYEGARPDVLRLVPDAPRRVLDAGCGQARLALDLRERFADVRVTGIEADPALRAVAATRCDRVIDADLDAWSPGDDDRGQYDVVIAADVLEHLRDPWRATRALRDALAPGGVMITSIPNVRHHSTLWALVAVGRWPYRARGIHDRTHLRYFMRADILEMLAGSGLEVLREARNLRLLEAWSWTKPPARLLDFWPLRPFFTFQYLHVSRRSDARA